MVPLQMVRPALRGGNSAGRLNGYREEAVTFSA